MPRLFTITQASQQFPDDDIGGEGDLAVAYGSSSRAMKKSNGSWSDLGTPLISTSPADAAEQFGIFTYGDLPGVSGAVTFNQTHSIAGYDIEQSTLITSLSFPNLIDVDPDNIQGGQINIYGMTALESVNFDALTVMGGIWAIQNSPVITSITGLSGVVFKSSFQLQFCTSLVNVDLSGCSFHDFSMRGNTVLTNIDLTGAIFADTGETLPEGTVIDAGDNLDVATINSILARLVANPDYVAGQVTLNYGTNAAPTGQGLTDKATLIGRGVTVTTF